MTLAHKTGLQVIRTMLITSLFVVGSSRPALAFDTLELTRERASSIVIGGYGLLGVLALAVLWLAVRALRRREPISIGAEGLPPLDETTMDAMYLDDRSPTGHLTAYIAEAQMADDPDKSERPTRPADDSAPEPV